MPLIKPEIQKILRAAGLEKEPGNESESLIDKLSNAGLSGDALAEEITNIALHSNNDHLRLRALETVLKVRGALKDQPPSLPSFTVVIQNSNKDLSETEGVNPILFPRQSLNPENKKN
jgi:hypothetical protein